MWPLAEGSKTFALLYRLLYNILYTFYE